MKKLLWAILLLPLSGCSLLANDVEKVAKAGGKLVNFYCANVSDESIRLQIREKVNSYASPNTVVVTCAGGGPQLRAGGEE